MASEIERKERENGWMALSFATTYTIKNTYDMFVKNKCREMNQSLTTFKIVVLLQSQ